MRRKLLMTVLLWVMLTVSFAGAMVRFATPRQPVKAGTASTSNAAVAGFAAAFARNWLAWSPDTAVERAREQVLAAFAAPGLAQNSPGLGLAVGTYAQRVTDVEPLGVESLGPGPGGTEYYRVTLLAQLSRAEVTAAGAATGTVPMQSKGQTGKAAAVPASSTAQAAPAKAATFFWLVRVFVARTPAGMAVYAYPAVQDVSGAAIEVATPSFGKGVTAPTREAVQSLLANFFAVYASGQPSSMLGPYVAQGSVVPIPLGSDWQFVRLASARVERGSPTSLVAQTVVEVGYLPEGVRLRETYLVTLSEEGGKFFVKSVVP
ncbi:MAG: conjugal transfer protein [Thermaerobacter sp.]|nr:conjugal transfer protein [Thermaerobacter sp.]